MFSSKRKHFISLTQARAIVRTETEEQQETEDKEETQNKTETEEQQKLEKRNDAITEQPMLDARDSDACVSL